MRTNAARPLTALLAFTVGCALSASGDFFRAPVAREAPARRASADALPGSFRLVEPLSVPRPPAPAPTPSPTPAAEPRVTQELIVAFPRLGKVSVRAVENFGETVRVEFVAYGSEVRLAAFPVSWSGGADAFVPAADARALNPFLRLDVLRPAGLATPLVLAVGVRPGGSGHGFCAVVIGEVGGRLQLLTPEPLATSNIGGVFVGDLGRGRGFGAAAWDFIWGRRRGPLLAPPLRGAAVPVRPAARALPARPAAALARQVRLPRRGRAQRTGAPIRQPARRHPRGLGLQPAVTRARLFSAAASLRADARRCRPSRARFPPR